MGRWSSSAFGDWILRHTSSRRVQVTKGQLGSSLRFHCKYTALPFASLARVHLNASQIRHSPLPWFRAPSQTASSDILVPLVVTFHAFLMPCIFVMSVFTSCHIPWEALLGQSTYLCPSRSLSTDQRQTPIPSFTRLPDLPFSSRSLFASLLLVYNQYPTSCTSDSLNTWIHDSSWLTFWGCIGARDFTLHALLNGLHIRMSKFQWQFIIQKPRCCAVHNWEINLTTFCGEERSDEPQKAVKLICDCPIHVFKGNLANPVFRKLHSQLFNPKTIALIRALRCSSRDRIRGGPEVGAY